MSATKMGLGIKKEAYEADNLEQIRFTKKKRKGYHWASHRRPKIPILTQPNEYCASKIKVKTNNRKE